MKAKKSFILIISVISVGLFSFVVDEDPLKNLLESLQKHFAQTKEEKVYLHTDKPYYAIGDHIWFKAYVLNANTLEPTSKSNILYVDLIDEKDSISKTLRLPLLAGLGWGNFELKDSLKEGNYRLRAYTNWMRNFDDAYFYDKTFKIGNAWTSQLVTSANNQYFKENGEQKVRSTLSFRNLDNFPYANKPITYNVVFDGKSVEKGKASTNEKGEVTIEFSSDKAATKQAGTIEASIELAKGTIVNKSIILKSASDDIDVQFFPEGGDLVNEVRSKVGFKALGADGLGKNVSGYIQDNSGNKVAVFSAKHLGMGYFVFTPMLGKTYEAVAKFEDGSEKIFKLQTAKEAGAVLSVNYSASDSVTIRVAVNQNFLRDNLDKEYTVIAQNHGNIIYTAKSKIKGLAFAAKLDKARFLQGINQVTLFDENLQPVAERLIFIAPTDTLNLQVQTAESKHSQRSKTTLRVKALSKSGKPVFGSFSLAVTDSEKVKIEEDEEDNIYSYLLLSSDIKGYIEKPNYYLNNINEEKERAVDLLMLTQAWRRFKWQDLNKPFNINYKPEETLSISGRVTQGKDKPVVNGDVTMFSSGGSSLLLQTKTDENGEFKVDSLYFPDSTKFVIQARTSSGKKNVEIEVYYSSRPIVSKISKADLTVNINQSMMAYLKNSKTQYEEWLRNGIVNRSILLGEVKVVETKKAVIENSANLNGAGRADNIFTAKDLETAFSIEQFLQGRVAGLVIQNGIAFIRNQQAQIIMDGIYVEPEFLSSINVFDVESIEILKSISYTAIYGSRGGGGVIVINTKRGGSGYTSNSWAPGILAYNPLGIFTPKEFYVPNYDDPKVTTNAADLRTTIYWNPHIVTDSLGVASVNYFNSDNTGKYKVVLEGTDLNGHIARKVVYYQVSPK